MQSTTSTGFGVASADPRFIDTLRHTLYGRAFLTVTATAFVALCAHVSVPLPFTPVPIVLSDFAVLLVGMVLGPVAGFWAMALYLAEGAIGMPVFSPHGIGGLGQLMGPTGGYLFAYPIAAAISGLAGVLARKNRTAFTSAILTGVVAIAVILTGGALWLTHIGSLSSSAWNLAVTPFLFGSLAKVTAAAMIFSSTRRWLSPADR